MGPKATSVLFEKIVDYTDASYDQEHPSVAILDNSMIPDRTKFILTGKGESPFIKISEALDIFTHILKPNGTIGMVCNTAHYFSEAIIEKSNEQGFSFINMPEMTLEYIVKSNPNKRCCILCTEGTKEAKIYEKTDLSELEICYPSKKQCEIIHKIIYQIKDTSNINYEEAALNLAKIMDNIGDCTFVLACTELSVLNKALLGDSNVVDAMDILAMMLVTKSGHSIKMLDSRYEEGIIRKM